MNSLKYLKCFRDTYDNDKTLESKYWNMKCNQSNSRIDSGHVLTTYAWKCI